MAEFLGLKKEALIQKCIDLKLPHEGKNVEDMRASLIQNAVEASKLASEGVYNPSPEYLEFLREKWKVEEEVKIKEMELRKKDLQLQALKAERLQVERMRLKLEEKRKGNPDESYDTFPSDTEYKEAVYDRCRLSQMTQKETSFNLVGVKMKDFFANVMSSAKADYEEFLKYRLEKNLKARENSAEPTGPKSKPLGVIATSATDTFIEPEPASPPSVSVEENKNTEDLRKEIKTDPELKVKRGKPEFETDVWDNDRQNREEERPSVLEAELSQHPFVTVTANKPAIGLNAGTKAEAIGKVEIEKEESKISLQLPADRQASYLSSASSEEEKLSQNTCLLESASEKLEHVSATETSIDTHVKEKVTVEANKVVTEKSKENPEKLQSESFLLEEDVEAKESKPQNAVLKEDIALQKERKDTNIVVTGTNVDPKEDNDFANEGQLCQFCTETVTMIEQLMDQRPRKAQLVKHNPNSESEQPSSREDQGHDDLSPAAVLHPRDGHSPADSGHPRDDHSPAVLQPRDNISLTEDFT